MLKYAVLLSIAVLSLGTAAQAQDTISLSNDTLVERLKAYGTQLREQTSLLNEILFERELSQMERELQQATAAIVFYFKNRSSSARREAENLYHEAVVEFERIGTQTSSRWSDELLEMFVQPIEADWQAFQDQATKILETEANGSRLSARDQRHLRELWELSKQIEDHLEALRNELVTQG